MLRGIVVTYLFPAVIVTRDLPILGVPVGPLYSVWCYRARWRGIDHEMTENGPEFDHFLSEHGTMESHLNHVT